MPSRGQGLTLGRSQYRTLLIGTGHSRSARGRGHLTRGLVQSDRRGDIDQYRHLTACFTCPLKPKCTADKRKRNKRWKHEGVLDAYRVHFVDYGDNVYSTEYIEHDDDEGAIAVAHRMNVPSIGAGFDVWNDDRLVHRHRN